MGGSILSQSSEMMIVIGRQSRALRIAAFLGFARVVFMPLL